MVAVPSGQGNLPCISTMKWWRSGIRKSTPRQPPRNETTITCHTDGCATPLPGSAASMYSAGMVNTAPETTWLELAPMLWTNTFSRSVLLRLTTWDQPMPRMAMGMAASMPWPSLRAT